MKLITPIEQQVGSDGFRKTTWKLWPTILNTNSTYADLCWKYNSTSDTSTLCVCGGGRNLLSKVHVISELATFSTDCCFTTDHPRLIQQCLCQNVSNLLAILACCLYFLKNINRPPEAYFAHRINMLNSIQLFSQLHWTLRCHKREGKLLRQGNNTLEIWTFFLY